MVTVERRRLILALCVLALWGGVERAVAQGCGDTDCNPAAGRTQVVEGQSPPYKVLGSPSGRAHEDVFGQPLRWVTRRQNGSAISGYEIWLLEPEGTSVSLRQGTVTPANGLDCNEHAAIGVYSEAIQVGDYSTFYPTFGGQGVLLGAIELDESTWGECFSTYCSLTGLEFTARSTDVDNDGDTDDDDQNLLIAAMGTGQMQYDLNFSGAVNPADLSVLLTEKNRAAYAWNCHQVTNLAVADVRKTNVKLTWTAVGDAGGNHATDYDLRYRTTPFSSEADWASATRVTPWPTPQAAGAAECFVVMPLTKCTSYYFGVRRADAAGHTTKMSNVATGTTTCTGNQILECDPGKGSFAGVDPDAARGSQARIIGPSIATSGVASFRVEMPQELAMALARVAVYDVGGRQVRSLYSGNLSSSTLVEWDLSDSRGARSGAGVYFVRVETADRVLNHRVTIVR